MKIDADRLAKQVKLAYDFMETIHGQAIALIKDVEGQLAQSPEDLQCLRPGGYRFTINQLTYGLERPQPTIADYYAIYFREFEDRAKKTVPFDERVPTLCFLKVVLRERGLIHPEVRYGTMSNIAKAEERGDRWPAKFEDLVAHITNRALMGPPPWSERGRVQEEYTDVYVSMRVEGEAVRLAEIPNSEVIADKIVDPLLQIYRETN